MYQPRLKDTHVMVSEGEHPTWLILITPEEESTPASVVLTTDDGITRVYVWNDEQTEKVRMRIRVAERDLELS